MRSGSLAIFPTTSRATSRATSAPASLASSLVLFVASCLAVAGCAGPDSPETATGDASSEWRGSVTTEGDVTTVVNESGSVWGGNARHVEEASIGVALGEEPYLFSSVRSVWATDGEVFVLDMQIAELRVFDLAGDYLRTIGRPGQGPGEFQSPYQLMVAPDGRIFVLDVGVYALLVLSPEGEEIDRWSIDPRELTGVVPWGVQLTHDGEVWMPAPAEFTRREREVGERVVMVDEPSRERVVQRFTGDGVAERRPVPVPDFEPLTEDGQRVPFSGRTQFMLSPTGDLVAGATPEYRFEIHRPDGTRTVVARRVPPPALDPEHFEWAVDSRIRSRRRREPGWSWAPDPPAHRPYYRLFLPDRTGRIWVIRPGDSEPVELCDPEPLAVPEGETPRPCFRTTLTADVFGRDGKFLGSVDDLFGGNWTGDVNFGYSASFLDGDTALFVHEDEAGTVMVKRYRLVLPGEGDR